MARSYFSDSGHNKNECSFIRVVGGIVKIKILGAAFSTGRKNPAETPSQGGENTKPPKGADSYEKGKRIMANVLFSDP